MRISRHHSRVLDAIAHGAQGEIAQGFKALIGRENISAADILAITRPIMEKRLREAYGWGVSFKAAQPDEPGVRELSVALAKVKGAEQ